MSPQPNILYRVSGQCNFDLLQGFESLIPGTLIYGKRSYGRRFRLKDATDEQKQEIVTCEIYAPLHAAWLVESSLAYNSLDYTYSATDIEGITGWSNEETQRNLLEDAGRQSSNQSVLSGELREHVLEIATPYQFMGVTWAQHRPWVMNVWACGSGKTLGTIMAALSRPGPILFVRQKRVTFGGVKSKSTHI